MTEIHATNGSTAVGRDNTGTIVTGDNNTITIINGTSEDVSDGGLWDDFSANAESLIRGVSATRLIGDTVVPISLAIRSKSTPASEDGDQSQSPISMEQLAKLVVSGSNVILSGEGGIGKTTSTLSLARALLAERPLMRIPIFIDAPAWASSNVSPFDYIASLPTFAATGITAAKLAKYAVENKMTLLVDGWNEIGSSSIEACLTRMRAFFAAATGINIVITTRNGSQRPDVASPVEVSVSGIDWRHQQDYIRARLPAQEADGLIEQLSLRPLLRNATRNPIILRGVVELGTRVQETVDTFMVYRAIVSSLESNSSRNAALSTAPVLGLQGAYLEALAWKLNSDGATTLAISDARSVLNAEIRALQASSQISNLVEPMEVLRELCDHHLLHQEQGLIRFAHQRFQEYFAACRYLSLLNALGDAAPNVALTDPINWPFWEDTLHLVAAHLSNESASSLARTALIRAAVGIDLSFACDLVASSKFERRDGPNIFDALVAKLNGLIRSSNADVVGYGFSCIIDSALPVFSDLLWQHLERDSQQDRLHFHRVGKNRISIHQLGPDALSRMASWSIDRRVEFIHEVAGNSANWEFLATHAFNASDDEIRAAAISAIRWEYPASDVPLQAWLQAPDSVKVLGDILGMLDEDLLEGGESVLAELRNLHERVDGETGNRIALRFPGLLPPPPTEYLVRRLNDEGSHHRNETVLALLDRVAPEGLTKLAIDKAFSSSYLPDWAVERVRSLDPVTRSELFNRAFDELISGGRDQLIARGLFSELANRDQVHAVLREYLVLHSTFLAQRQDFSDQDRYFALQSLLHDVDGSYLVSAAIQEAGTNQVPLREKSADLIRHRASVDYDGRTRASWTPSVDEVDALIATLLDGTPSTTLSCTIADIASQADPDRYQDLLLDCCSRELDDWSTYRSAISQWVQSGGGRDRPVNPPNGMVLSRALVRWGFNALPGLRQLIDHSEAENFVFSAISSILQQPWLSSLPSGPGIWHREIANLASMRRKTNRTMRQPTSDLQHRTDECASQLVQQYIIDLRQLADPTIEAGKRKYVQSRIYRMVLALARIPSPLVVEPVLDAIANGHVPDDTTVESIESLLNQGLTLDDPKPATRLCTIWEGMASQRWPDQSQQYRFRTLSHMLLRLPHAFLTNLPAHYLERWITAGGLHEVAKDLARDESVETFGLLCQMLRDANADSHAAESIAQNIVSALTSETVQQFIALIADGSFFGQRGWYMENIAVSVLSKIGESSETLSALLDACVLNNSRRSIAFACLLLAGAHADDAQAYSVAARSITADNSALDVNATLEFKRLFFRNQPLEGNSYRVLPLASNRLRKHFFTVAGSSGRFSGSAKSLLCKVEADRHEGGRPNDEPRHPDLASGLLMADVLIT